MLMARIVVLRRGQCKGRFFVGLFRGAGMGAEGGNQGSGFRVQESSVTSEQSSVGRMAECGGLTAKYAKHAKKAEGGGLRGRERVLRYPQGLPRTAVRGPAGTVVWEPGGATLRATRLGGVVISTLRWCASVPACQSRQQSENWWKDGKVDECRQAAHNNEKNNPGQTPQDSMRVVCDDGPKQ